MKRKIYLSCEKEKRQYFKNKIKEYTENIMIVNNMSDADTCLCIGYPDELMEEDIIMAQESGIEIQGDKGVNIVSATSVSIQAQSEIEIAAENQIVVGTPNAYLMITKDAATLTAPTVNID